MLAKQVAVAAVAAAALFVAARPGAALAGEAAAAPPPAIVEIRNFQFLPATLTVTAGTTVTWKNDDASPHTVAAADGSFRSAALDTKDSYSHAFATPGTHVYLCTIHPMMVGKVIVKPAGPPS